MHELTDEVDGNGGEFLLGQSIGEGLLLHAALHVRVHHDTGELRVCNQALGERREGGGEGTK